MRRTALCVLAASLALAVGVHAETIGITTFASANHTLPAVAVSTGPWPPLSPLGLKASGTFSPGPINVSVGGGTTFTMPTVAQGTVFTQADSLTFGYSPTWSGTVNALADVSADLKLHYDIAIFSGDINITQTQASAWAKGLVSQGGALQSGSASDTGTTTAYGLQVDFFNLLPPSTASLGARVEGRLTQSVSWAPTAEYGYWWWADTNSTYDPGDESKLQWYGVTSGLLRYPFSSLVAPPASTFFLNFIPGVMLSMPIAYNTTFGLDFTGFARATLFGVEVARANFPLGSLNWTLLNGTYLFDPWWYANEVFSIPLAGNCTIDPFTGQQTCTGWKVPAQTSKWVGSGPPSGGPRGVPFMPAPSFVPSGFDDAFRRPVCVDTATGQKCYDIGDDELGGDPDEPPQIDISVKPVPEPATQVLLGAGLVGLAWRGRRQARS